MPEGYQHETVNHNLHFIDPETGAYTNTIESLWQKFKQGHKARYGDGEGTFAVLHGRIFTKKYGESALHHLWSQIQEHYPLPRSAV